MQCQRQRLEPLAHRFQEAAGFAPVLAALDDVIGMSRTMIMQPLASKRRQRSAHGSKTECRETLARSGEIAEPCPLPLSPIVTTPSSRMPAVSHLLIRRMMRLSPTRCSTSPMSQSWLAVSKNDRISASSLSFTLVLEMPSASASSASCWPRPGRNPYETPRTSSS